jgi:hypothetical protein
MRQTKWGINWTRGGHHPRGDTWELVVGVLIVIGVALTILAIYSIASFLVGG